jgi:CRP-like cAMP-binding protein
MQAPGDSLERRWSVVEHPARPTLLALLGRVARTLGLTAITVRELAERAMIVDWSAGRTICVSGDHDDFVNCLVRGTVCVDLVPRWGKSIALQLIGSGELFCLPPPPRSGAYHLRAIAYDASLVALWSRTAIADVLGMLPASATVQLFTVSWISLSRVAEEKCALLSMPLGRRIEFVLSGLARRFGRPVEQGILVDLSLSDEQLGHVVHAGRSSVNRQMMGLRRAGLIERIGDRIVVAREIVTRQPLVRCAGADECSTAVVLDGTDDTVVPTRQERPFEARRDARDANGRRGIRP